MLLTVAVPDPPSAGRTAVAGALIALAATDSLFDEDPATAPSGDQNPDGARNFPADPSVATCRLICPAKCGFAKDEGEILVKELH